MMENDDNDYTGDHGVHDNRYQAQERWGKIRGFVMVMMMMMM